MRRLITISFLLFIALCGWANGTVSAKDSICIIEGTVKNLPDGCDVILYGSAGKYSGNQKTITQIKKGKFHFEKKVKGDEKYEVFLFPCIESLTLFVSPGTKTIITGNGTHPSTWNAKSDNPLQKEWNAYQKFEADSLSEYTTIRLKLNDIEAELYKNNTESEKMSLLKEREELLEKHNNLSKKYVEVLYNFMKDRAYSDVYANKLKSMADKAIELMEESIAEKAIRLLQKVPQEESKNIDVKYTQNKLMGNKKYSRPTEMSTALSIKTICTSVKDKGWCTFYDAEKSYEVDGHTDIYTICENKTTGIMEMTDKSDRIIPAGNPVILHLNNIMEDNTHYAVLTEVQKNILSSHTGLTFLDVSTKGEKIKAWRIGISSEDNKVAFYPWETENAEDGIVYFRIPTTYIKDSKIEVAQANTKWNIDQKKAIGHTQWHTRNLQNMPFSTETAVEYCESAKTQTDIVKVIGLSGKPVKIAEGNDMIYPRFLAGNTFIEDKIWGNKSFHLAHFGKDDWGAPEKEFYRKENNEFIYLRFIKGKDNSILFTEGGCPTGLHTLTVIPNASCADSIANTARHKVFDMSDLKDFMFWGEHYHQLSDSTIIVAGAPGMNTNHIISIIDYKNLTCKPLNYWPNDDIMTNAVEKQYVYTYLSGVYGNGKGNYLFVCDRERYAFIFSIDGDNVNVIKDLYTTNPNYEAGDGHYPICHRVRTEKLYCETTNDNIYFLLTDKDKFGKKIKIEDYNRQYLYGNTIEIYDWDGKQRKKVIKLDHIGQRIIISDDGKTLYLFTDDFWEGDPNPQIWAYDISNLDSLTGTDLSTETYEFADFSSQNIVKNPTKVVEEGDMMADFELYDYEDKPHHLNEFLGSGKYTILEFSGLNCGPCQMARPLLEKLYQDNKDKFEMITISTDNEKVWKKKPLGEVSWHEWNDHKMAREISLKYGVQAIPTFVIISPEGKIEKKCRALSPFFEAMEKYIPAEKLEEYLKIKNGN